MLVLAVIVVVSAVAIPSIFEVLANRQLVRGADGLRVAMVQARIEAMRGGRTQMLRVELAGDHFQITPLYQQSDVTEAADQMGQGVAVATGGVAVATQQMNGPLQDPVIAEDKPRDMLEATMDQNRLPEGVSFASVQVQATARSATMQQALGTAGAGGAGAVTGWSEPILFYADGTTSNAVVTVTRENVGRVLIKIRGLTGETQVTEVRP